MLTRPWRGLSDSERREWPVQLEIRDSPDGYITAMRWSCQACGQHGPWEDPRNDLDYGDQSDILRSAMSHSAPRELDLDCAYPPSCTAP